MHSAARLGLALSEETLTECCLYNIALAHQGKDIVIDLATRSAESKHGADWEWWLVHGTKALAFRVQAKRLFPNGRYNSLTKSGANPYRQLDKLVSTAARAGFEPLYCFFNFSHRAGQFNGPNLCAHSYRAPSYWGCSLGFPDQVKQAKSTELAKLNYFMFPWHLLVCESDAIDLLSATTKFVRIRGRRNPASPRDLPSRVRRLIELGDERRRADYRSYLDDSFWDDESDTPDDVAGLIVIRDLRG
jgi:hypothetical protein